MHKFIETYFGENLLRLKRVVKHKFPVPEMYLSRENNFSKHAEVKQ